MIQSLGTSYYNSFEFSADAATATHIADLEEIDEIEEIDFTFLGFSGTLQDAKFRTFNWYIIQPLINYNFNKINLLIIF